MKKWKKILGISLIVIGAVVILTALGMRFYSNKKQQVKIEHYQKYIDDSKSAKASKEDVNTPPTQDNYGTIGIMLIPKIDTKVAISEGADLETLKYAVGHFKDTAMPGEKGNFCVAGHRSYTYNEAFNRLDEVKIGDEIIVKTVKGQFKYKVNEIKVVLPTETSVLDATEDATITLVTCTPIRVATHRLIVKGKLVQ